MASTSLMKVGSNSFPSLLNTAEVFSCKQKISLFLIVLLKTLQVQSAAGFGMSSIITWREKSTVHAVICLLGFSASCYRQTAKGHGTHKSRSDLYRYLIINMTNLSMFLFCFVQGEHLLLFHAVNDLLVLSSFSVCHINVCVEEN